MKPRAIRVPDDLWDATGKVADVKDRDRSYLLRKFMEQQVRDLRAA
jgi:predicted transcriptional regulator